jgi:hypothetical protein
MASQVLTGSANPAYTNNTGQNVRVIIYYMDATTDNTITVNWAGVSATAGNVTAMGKNIAFASAFYGELSGFKWWRKNQVNPRVSMTGNNLAYVVPTIEGDLTKKGIRRWFTDTLTDGIVQSVALPTEVFLAPNQTFSAICGPYNIVVMPENG